jgi:protein-S-isoprenylcysteine O-methyltransferase Ste14
MSNADWTRVLALYFPIVFASLAGIRNGRIPRQFAACLLSLLWVMPTLWALQRLNASRMGWWWFADADLPLFMPLELYVGWGVLWGVLPQLAFPRLRLVWVATVMILLDLLGMPLCGAEVRLGSQWLVGEAVAVVVVLIPALCLARWTLEDSHLFARSAMQVAISGMIFLYLVPEIAFSVRPGEGWRPLLEMGFVWQQAWIEVMAIVALPGMAAVMEFAETGHGTPIPYDPPKRLVVSGVYRYCRNPMQICCGLTMLMWALLLRNVWLVAGAGISFIYSAGIAEWDERQDLSGRFGARWEAYRAAVRNWIPRWRPYIEAAPATLYIARTCGPCSELRRWIEIHAPLGLELVDAEMLPAGSITRLRYVAEESCEGVRALGRALEHFDLGWALLGAALRLPVLAQGIQLLADVSGFGPRLTLGA